MQKVSYVGDGSTTEFTFNFPYFENTNIVVTKNGTTATGYSVVGTSAGMDADIPYAGGKVVFETAPLSTDSITIARDLPMSRVADYQPTAKIEPTTLNQDLNYMMEVLKDLQDELDGFSAQYADIVDKDSTAILLTKIAAIHDEIVTVSAQIIALGNIGTLTQTVTSHGNNITTLDNRTTGILDYVIESQTPSAQNNYTWYRKYKSGWIEQGGIASLTENPQAISLVQTFSNTNYTLVTCNGDLDQNSSVICNAYYSKSTSSFTVVSGYDGTFFNTTLDWYACGF